MALTQENLNLGTVDNDGTGDTLKVGGTKIENNFGDLFTFASDLLTTLGISDGDTDLGTFTGATITDNVNLLTALQEIETALEALSPTVAGQYAGSASTFAALPTTIQGGSEAVDLNDWAILTIVDGVNDTGLYLYDGAAWQFDTSLDLTPQSILTSDNTADASHTQEFADFSQTWNNLANLTVDQEILAIPGNYGSTTFNSGTFTINTVSPTPSSVDGELIMSSNLVSLTGDSGGIAGGVGFVIDNSTITATLGDAQVFIKTIAVNTASASDGEVLSLLDSATGEVEFVDINETVELLTVTAQNTITDLTVAPTNLNSLKVFVNGIMVDNLASSGIAVDIAGVITVTPADLGYNIETTDRVVAYYR